MQNRVGENRIERPIEPKIRRVGHLEMHIRKLTLRLRDHLRGIINSQNLAATLGDLMGQMPRAAPQIEHALTGFWQKKIEQIGAEFPDEGVLVVVEFCVPGIGIG